MTKKAKPWKRLASTNLFTHGDLSILEDLVELPNRKKTSYVRQAPTASHSVIMIAINSTGKVLVQQEYSYPPNKVMWQLPGGSMKPHETVEQAAKRELAEESGYGTKAVKVLGSFYTNNRFSNQVQYVVICEDLYPKNLPEDLDEFIDTFWMSRKGLKNMIAQGKFDNINLLAALNLWFQSSAN